MKISASLFSKKSEWVAYANQLEYAGVDYIHIDYLEGEMAPIAIEALTPKVSSIPYDVHVIARKLQVKTVLALNKTPTAYFCVQYENLADKSDLKNLRLFNGLCGIAFTIDTPLEILEQYRKEVDFILIMCSTPGVSGATFNEKNLDRIQVLRKKYPDLPLHVDGGINQERTQLMENLGVSLCVSGSYLASTDGMELIRRVCGLKFRNMDVRAVDIMSLRKNITPIQPSSNFYDLIRNIDCSRMGTAFVEDENQRFVGIITDGDVRRMILSKQDQVFSQQVADIVNENAYSVGREKKLADIFLERMLLRKEVTVIPVVENNMLIGVIDLKKYF